MKVLVVGTGGSLAGSGITTATDQMVRTLQGMGHEATRLVAGDRPRKRPNRLNLENVWAVIADCWQVARAVRRTRASVVWYHTFGVPTLPALRALVVVVASRVAGARAIVHVHAFGLEEFVSAGGRGLRWIYRTLDRLVLVVVVLHDSARSSLIGLVRPERVVVLANWVDVPAHPTAIPDGPPYRAVFVGALIARKGITQLIEAVRMLDDIPLELIVVGGAGDDGASAAEAIRRRADDLVRAGRLHFRGQLDPASVRRELRAAQIFVLPSAAEGMPLSMLEALAEGRPVVVSDAGNMAAIVRDTHCGVVLPSTTPLDIADTLREVLRDHPALVAAGQSAHNTASERYSGGAAEAQVAEILRGRS